MSGSRDRDSRRSLVWFRSALRSDHGAIVVLRETLTAALVVLFVGTLLFSVSGLWPPMVAIESGSMEPVMTRGDLIFVVEEHRFSSDLAHGDTGVVTAERGAVDAYRTFGSPGDVIVYRPDGATGRTPVIHRAHFWVNDSENWYAKANPAYLSGDSCDQVRYCPAPHAGFITKGDANDVYDQTRTMGITGPVRPDWVVGTAEVRVPYLGYVRLALAGR